MLASLLPGLREIRTPLIVGYSWIVVLYFAVAHRLPDTKHATGVLADAYKIGRLIPPAGMLAVASVVAYLLGVIALPATSWLTRTVLRWRRVRWLDRLPGTSSEERLARVFDEISVERLADRVRDDADFRAALVQHGVEVGKLGGAEIDQARLDQLLLKSPDTRRDAVNEAIDDGSRSMGDLKGLLPLMVQRMRSHEERAATEYDRHTSESDFRSGMAWPLLALLVVLAVRASTWWLTGLPAVLLLLQSADAAALEAGLLLAAVVAARRYEEPSLQWLQGVSAQHMLDQRASSAYWASGAARAIVALAVSPDGTVIAGGADDGYLFLWDAATGELRHSLAAHRDYISDLVFSLDGTHLVTAGGDSVVHVWDPGSGERRHTLSHHQRLIVSLAVEPGTGMLLAASQFNVICWDLVDGELVWERSFGESLISEMSVSPDGTMVLRFLTGPVFLVRDGWTLRVSVPDDRRIFECVALDDGGFVTIDATFQLICWRPPGKGGPRIGSSNTGDHAAAPSVDFVQTVLSAADNTFVPLVVAHAAVGPRLFCTDEEDKILMFRPDRPGSAQICGQHEGSISALAVSADLTTVVSASRAGTVQVRKLGNPKMARRLVPAV